MFTTQVLGVSQRDVRKSQAPRREEQRGYTSAMRRETSSIATGASEASSPSAQDRRITWYLCLIAAAAVLSCAFHGIGMDQDSTGYLSAATNLAHGRGLVGFGGTAFTLFGPAFPAFVAAGIRLGLTPEVSAVALNVVSAILTVILGRVILKRHVSDARLIFAGSVLLAIGWPLIQVTSLAVPEPMTVVVLLALALILEDFDKTDHPAISLCVVILLLNLSFFLRYANLAFIPVAILVVFFSRKNGSRVFQRLLYSTILTLLALLGPCLWMIRNHSVDGSLLGPRSPSVFGVATVAHQYVLAIAKLFLPGPSVFEDAVFVVVVILMGIALRLIYLAEQRSVMIVLDRIRSWSVLLLMCVIYAVYLYAAELSTSIDPIDARLLVPLYVPCMILIIGVIDAVFRHDTLSPEHALLASRALALFLAVQVLISCALIGDFASKGRDLTSIAWRTSPLVAAANKLARTAPIYTNEPADLWARLGKENIYPLPSSLARVRKDLACPGILVVYFTHGPPSYENAISVVGLSALKSDTPTRLILADDQGEVLRTMHDAQAAHRCG